MEVATRNEVTLVGRLAAAALDKEMPSGDVITTWRLIVERAPSGRKLPEGVKGATVDTLDCVAWRSSIQRAAAAWEAGDLVSVEGSLRRRFWRIPTGATSRCEVEVTKAKRVARAG